MNGPEDRILEQDVSLEHLTARALSGGFLTLSAQGLKFLVTLLAAIILGRLLDPHDFGLVGMVTTVTGFLAIFSDVGLSTATIQAEDLTHELVSNLFWMNVGVGACLGVLTLCLAPALAWFYGEPRLVAVTAALSLSLPITGLFLQHQAILNRQMRFGKLAMIEVGSLSLSTMVGCFLAKSGFKYWSLIGMQLASSVCAGALTWYLSPWRPGFPRRDHRTGALFSFGLDLTASSIALRLARSSDTLLLGRFWGPTSVGLYSRANVLLVRPIEQFLSPIGAVMFPVLSRLRRHPEKYRRTFLRAYALISLLSFPLTAWIVAAARPLVLVILGPKWEGSAALLAGMALYALYLPLASSATWLFTSQGRSRDLLKTNLILSALMVLAFLVGVRRGALAMVLWFSLSGLSLRLPLLYLLVGRHGPVQAKDLWAGFAENLPTWLAVYGSTTLTVHLASNSPPIGQLIIALTAGVLAGSVVICLRNQQRRRALFLLSSLTVACRLALTRMVGILRDALLAVRA